MPDGKRAERAAQAEARVARATARRVAPTLSLAGERLAALLARCGLGCVFATIFAHTSLADAAAYGGRRDIVAHGSTLTAHHRHDWSRIPQVSSGWLLQHSPTQPFGTDLQTSDLRLYSPDGSLIAQVPSPPLTHLTVSADGRYVIGLSAIKFLNGTQLAVFNQHGDLLLRRRISAYVYCFDRKEYEELEQKHADVFLELERHAQAMYSGYGWQAGDRVYLDVGVGLSQENWAALFPDIFPSRCRSPLLSQFSESVTNWIRWYHETDPRPYVVERDGQPFEVRLRDPRGDEFGVPFRLTPLEP